MTSYTPNPVEFTELQQLTTAIMGNLKVLWRSQALADDLDHNPNALFTAQIGDLGDRYIIQHLMNQVQQLHTSVAELITRDSSHLDRLEEQMATLRQDFESKIQPKKTLRDQLFAQLDKYGLHEVLEALSDLFYIQSELCDFDSDRSNLKEITQFVSEAQSVAELISDSFEMS